MKKYLKTTVSHAYTVFSVRICVHMYIKIADFRDSHSCESHTYLHAAMQPLLTRLCAIPLRWLLFLIVRGRSRQRKQRSRFDLDPSSPVKSEATFERDRIAWRNEAKPVKAAYVYVWRRHVANTKHPLGTIARVIRLSDQGYWNTRNSARFT